MTSFRPLLGLVAVTLIAVAGCGANSDDGRALTPAAEDGRKITRTNGCASCHGSNGQGGVGPPFVGLFGSERPLDDGSTVIADEAYLRTSIIEPGAQKVAGYNLPMPTSNLSDDQIDQVITYITELAEPADGSDGAAGTGSLSAIATEGEEISRTKGCAACHGSNGQGGVGGAYVGLFGSEVELDDGTVVVADEEYIREAIVDPDAARPADAELPMPSNNLSDEEVDRLVAYIVELGGDASTS